MEPTLCKIKGMVNNPNLSRFGGVDTDVDWVPKCDCAEGECKNIKEQND